MLRLLERLKPLCKRHGARLGLAPHSLRAVPPDALTQAVRGLQAIDPTAPIHIHIAEQTGEVDACLAWSGQRPVQWLLDHAPVDERWCLVHATHMTPDEYQRAARSGAVAGICPSTEANLGDGLPDLPRWFAAQAITSIGSDSQVCRQWPAELRLLELGQRLALRQRNVAAAPQLGQDATAARLFNRSMAGGAAAAGFDRWGLVVGARADLLVMQTDAEGLAGVPSSHVLDALVFATDGPAFCQVWVAGQQRVDHGHHQRHAALRTAFADTMAQLWPAGTA